MRQWNDNWEEMPIGQPIHVRIDNYGGSNFYVATRVTRFGDLISEGRPNIPMQDVAAWRPLPQASLSYLTGNAVRDIESLAVGDSAIIEGALVARKTDTTWLCAVNGIEKTGSPLELALLIAQQWLLPA